MKYIFSLPLSVQPEMNSSQVDNLALGTQVDRLSEKLYRRPSKMLLCESEFLSCATQIDLIQHYSLSCPLSLPLRKLSSRKWAI